MIYCKFVQEPNVWGLQISNLTKECNFDVANFKSITRSYSTKMHNNSTISYVRFIITQFLRTKPKFIYFSGNQQSILFFTKIKNLLNLNC